MKSDESAEPSRFHAVLREIGNLHDRKREDYGTDEDPFANVRAWGEWGVPEWVGAAGAADEKLRRLKSYQRNGRLTNEGAEESFRDIAVYAVIGLLLFEEAQAAPPPDPGQADHPRPRPPSRP